MCVCVLLITVDNTVYNNYQSIYKSSSSSMNKGVGESVSSTQTTLIAAVVTGGVVVILTVLAVVAVLGVFILRKREATGELDFSFSLSL